MTPRTLFRRIAVAEAITWALLLFGMFLKYVTETTELGVRIFGMVHGVVFIAYCLVTLVVWIDAKWSFRTGLLGLASAVPPFVTVVFDLWAERRGHLADEWRLSEGSRAASPLERMVAALLAHPVRGLLAGAAAVAVLTAVALLVGPPTSGVS